MQYAFPFQFPSLVSSCTHPTHSSGLPCPSCLHPVNKISRRNSSPSLFTLQNTLSVAETQGSTIRKMFSALFQEILNTKAITEMMTGMLKITLVCGMSIAKDAIITNASYFKLQNKLFTFFLQYASLCEVDITRTHIHFNDDKVCRLNAISVICHAFVRQSLVSLLLVFC